MSGFTSTSSNVKLLREMERSLKQIGIAESGLVTAVPVQIAAIRAASAVRARLVTPNGTVLHTETVGAHTHLVVEDHARVATQYKFATHDGAATTALATPRAGGAVVITDLIIGGEKRTNATVVVQFTDGTDTAGIISPVVNDAPVNLHIPFAGRFRGWKDARIDFITDTANQIAGVTVGYYFISGEGVLTFADWDAQR